MMPLPHTCLAHAHNVITGQADIHTRAGEQGNTMFYAIAIGIEYIRGREANII